MLGITLRLPAKHAKKKKIFTMKYMKGRKFFFFSNFMSFKVNILHPGFPIIFFAFFFNIRICKQLIHY